VAVRVDEQGARPAGFDWAGVEDADRGIDALDRVWTTPLNRLVTLCDPGTFRPLMTGARSPRLDGRGEPGDGVLVGLGEVEGQPICCYAQDPSFLGGSLGASQADSIVRLLRMAERARVPVVSVVESAGARLHEGLPALAGYARIFRETVRLSGTIPQISVIGGTSAGGGCYSPALTDIIVMTQTARMFLTGPAIVRQAVGEETDALTLGGPRVHSRNGVADVVAEDMGAALAVARELVNLLREPDAIPPRRRRAVQEDQDLVDAALPADARKPYDIRTVARTLVDGGTLLELSPRWARNIVTALARIEGRTVAIVANQPGHLGGLLDVAACEKGASFIGMCDRLGVPMIVLVDTPGFMPGSRQEGAGIIRHGATLVRAFAAASVPRITLVVKKAYGGAFITMNSKDLGADLVLAWPHAEIGIMGAAQAVSIVRRREIEASDPETAEALAREYAEEHLRPEAAAACGAVDEIVEPRTTRSYLNSALSVLRAPGRARELG
jgi:acetyl-CoA carboxylase carboxyltransferase component